MQGEVHWMSWLNDLYLTYEACKSEVGVIKDNQPLLLPIAHLTQNAHLEIILDKNGNFNRAKKVDKADAVTVVPITEDSGSRSGNAVFPHPLADKLEYIAGDYGNFVSGSKKEKFEKYIEQLKKWAQSEYSLPQINSVYQYLCKGRVMQDLLEEKIFAYENGTIIAEKQQGTEAKDWFVRFVVEIPGQAESRLYCDTQAFESYIQFYLSQQKHKDLCYVSGEEVPCSEKHPSKIRHTGDKAKLISSNNASGVLTFKGRFSESSQVASVSYEISQKAHSALRWLIAKQDCLRVGEQVFVVWSMENPELKNPFYEIFGEMTENAYTDEAYANQVKKAIWGSSNEPKASDHVIVMGVEAATTGRLSVPFYQKYEAKQFLQNIAKWKMEACWLIKSDKVQYVVPWSPSLIDIAKQIAGDKNEKANKSLRERLIPCIVEGRGIPYDVVLSMARRAMNPMHYDNDWEWNKAITTACALLRKWQIEKENGEEGYSMELNEESKDRSYIFGQLIATAEMLERSAIGSGKETVRNTAAEKYFVRFQRYPVETWNTIRNQLQPYIMKLSVAGKRFYIDRMNELTARLDLTQKDKLEPTFLQGYSCQLMYYREHFKKQNSEKTESNE